MEEEPRIGQEILENSFECLPMFDEACVEAASIVFRSSDNTSNWTLKNHIHFRVGGVPPNISPKGSSFPKVGDRWKFVSFTGYVAKITKKFVSQYRKELLCDKCNHLNVYEAEYEDQYRFPEDFKKICQNKPCKSRSFTEKIAENGLDLKYFRDYQEIKVKENSDSKSCGTIPASVSVTLEDDLADKTKVGDVVTVW